MQRTCLRLAPSMRMKEMQRGTAQGRTKRLSSWRFRRQWADARARIRARRVECQACHAGTAWSRDQWHIDTRSVGSTYGGAVAAREFRFDGPDFAKNRE